MAVFVLDKRKRPVMPCSEKRARLLLERGRAVGHRRYPFTIRLWGRARGDVQPVRVKLDPGSTTTGIAVVADEDGNKPAKVLCLFELAHRGRACAYCGVTDVPLNLDHLRSRARGGSSRVSNLVLACIACNKKKSAQPVEVFLADKPAVLAKVKAHARSPLKDTAAVNVTRWALYEALADTGLPVEASSGGRTKFNRCRLGIPKSHALDAACVGKVDNLVGWEIPTVEIKAMGRGDDCRTKLDRYGFPRGYCVRAKAIRGFQTGDMVRAEVPKGKALRHPRRARCGACNRLIPNRHRRRHQRQILQTSPSRGRL